MDLKSHMNAIGNSRNPYQGGAKRVLTICSAGLLRSPTAANVLTETYGFNCRAAGITEEYALIPVTEVLIFWADEIVFMEQTHLDQFQTVWKDHKVAQAKITEGKFQVLGIPDSHERNNPVLRQLIVEAYDEKKNLTKYG